MLMHVPNRQQLRIHGSMTGGASGSAVCHRHPTAWSYPVGVMSEARFGHIGDNAADSLVRIVWPWEIVEQLVHCSPQEILVLVCVV